jgi:3-oxoacyl-[acyl-carrier protein] reductase
MLLEGKNAVVYGAGSVGRAIAIGFAAEGATVHLANRSKDKADEVAEEIRAAGGTAGTAELDVLDEDAVDRHIDGIAEQTASIDIGINVIGVDDVQGTPMAEMTLADYERPIVKAVRSTFLTWRALGRHMIRQRSGVVLAFGGRGDPIRDYSIGGFQVALAALEAMRRQLSAELGRHGVRAVTLRTGGVPESIPAGTANADEITAGLTAATLLGRTATLADVGNVAAFVASEKARTMTAATVNVSAGALLD